MFAAEEPPSVVSGIPTSIPMSIGRNDRRWFAEIAGPTRGQETGTK
jgi:hypothetical protein